MQVHGKSEEQQRRKQHRVVRGQEEIETTDNLCHATPFQSIHDQGRTIGKRVSPPGFQAAERGANGLCDAGAVVNPGPVGILDDHVVAQQLGLKPECVVQPGSSHAVFFHQPAGNAQTGSMDSRAQAKRQRPAREPAWFQGAQKGPVRRIPGPLPARYAIAGLDGQGAPGQLVAHDGQEIGGNPGPDVQDDIRVIAVFGGQAFKRAEDGVFPVTPFLLAGAVDDRALPPRDGRRLVRAVHRGDNHVEEAPRVLDPAQMFHGPADRAFVVPHGHHQGEYVAGKDQRRLAAPADPAG